LHLEIYQQEVFSSNDHLNMAPRFSINVLAAKENLYVILKNVKKGGLPILPSSFDRHSNYSLPLPGYAGFFSLNLEIYQQEVPSSNSYLNMAPSII